MNVAAPIPTRSRSTDFIAGDAVHVANYIPPVIAEVIAAHGGRAWVRWPNGVDAIVPVDTLERAL